ncbi:MAG: Wzz/FepE/Etk N-terminal domain-containing protein, partial [Candidatus Methylomirabilales bacterium]
MEEEDTATIELRQYTALLLRWLWLIILGAFLAGASAYVVSELSTPIYEATSTLVINEGQKAT